MPEARKPIVSVIVPTYNVERFLDQALDSIERQSLRDIEIICVNDGSTDRSGDIMRAHADRDARVLVIDKSNGGYGSACNAGLRRASGTWVAIVEPDDWILPDMLHDMVTFADSFDESIDIVKTPYWRIVDPDTPQQRRLNCSYKGRIRPLKQPFAIDDAHVDHLLVHHPSIWSALYSMAFIDEKHIRFHEIPGAGWADNPFLVETLCQARAIAYLDRAYYCYREETEGKSASFAQRNALVPLQRWHDMMDSLERLGVHSNRVLAAQYRRGFTYLDYICKGASLDEPDVLAEMERMFSRMREGLVLSNPHIPPAWKRRYIDTLGLEGASVSAFPYYASLVGSGLYSLKNIGPAETWRLVTAVRKRDRDSHHAHRDAQDSAEPKAPLPSVSIIVPVYNSQDYLAECLDSLSAQGDDACEIVCVDDGSVDSSRAIVERRQAEDGRFRLLSQPNGGPSSARNAGIEAARGDFLVFVDSDDVLEPGACRRIREALAEEPVDAVVFGWSCFPGGPPDSWLAAHTDVSERFYPRFEPAVLFAENTNPYLRLAVRRDSLMQLGIRFDERLFIGEDCAFLFSLFPRIGAVRLIPDKLYRYRMPHEGSIMSTAIDGTASKCLDDLNMMISIFGDWSRDETLERFGAPLMHWFISFLLYTALRQPPALRDSLVALVKQLWLAHFTADDLSRLQVPHHDRALMNVVIQAHDDGSLALSGRALARTLVTWRLAEYGPIDLARRILGK